MKSTDFASEKLKGYPPLLAGKSTSIKIHSFIDNSKFDNYTRTKFWLLNTKSRRSEQCNNLFLQENQGIKVILQPRGILVTNFMYQKLFSYPEYVGSDVMLYNM